MKQKILSLFCIITLIISLFSITLATDEIPSTLWINNAASSFEGGDGTEFNPYLIKTPAQLAYLAKIVNEDDIATGYDSRIWVKLIADIDMKDHKWEALNPFWGNFDGDNYEIQNLKGESLIGYLPYGEFSNIKIRNCNTSNAALIEATGSNGGIIDNCSVTGVTKYGGLIGRVFRGSYLYINNCYSTADVSGYNAGGLIGSINQYANITNCYTTGNVSGVDCVGGLVGSVVESAVIINCYSTGNVTATGNYVGGLIGYWGEYQSSTMLLSDTQEEIVKSEVENSNKNIALMAVNNSGIYNSYATGDVSSTGDYVGGFVGFFDTENQWVKNAEYIEYCYANGNVTGNNYVGGFAGFVDPRYYITILSKDFTYGYVRYCYATGNVSGNDYVGGFAAENKWELCCSYASGTVTGKGDNISGFTPITITYSDKVYNILYNQTKNLDLYATIYANEFTEAGKTEEELKSSEILTTIGSNFTSDITPNINDGYPILKWQLEAAPFEVNFTITDLSKEYTGEELTPTIKNDRDMLEGRDYTVTYDGAEEIPIETGTYEVEILLTESASEYYTIAVQITTIFEIMDIPQLTVNNLELLPDNSILISIFNDEDSISGTIFAGIYENNRLIEIKYIDKALIEQNDSEFTIKFDTELNQSYFIKSFVWDNTGNINPISGFLEKQVPLKSN